MGITIDNTPSRFAAARARPLQVLRQFHAALMTVGTLQRGRHRCCGFGRGIAPAAGDERFVEQRLDAGKDLVA